MTQQSESTTPTPVRDTGIAPVVSPVTSPVPPSPSPARRANGGCGRVPSTTG